MSNILIAPYQEKLAPSETPGRVEIRAVKHYIVVKPIPGIYVRAVKHYVVVRSTP